MYAKTVPKRLQNSEPPRSWWVLAARTPEDLAKIAPRQPQDAQDGLKRLQDNPKRAPRSAKRRPEAPGTPPRPPPRGPKRAPREPKKSRRGAEKKGKV